ncbi:MAG: hypothetical protein Ct9H300mP12_15180 [Acidimicrobiales bacterium]|nr:MAG: hypothetical protein Ct9H300mP12_15180 [Acidimicrobiales bacterium]
MDPGTVRVGLKNPGGGRAARTAALEVFDDASA